MRPCPEEVVEYMHDYLDGDLALENEKVLKEHLQSCEDCNTYFYELKKALALVQSTSHIQAPADFTEKVMERLPKEKKKVGVNRWLRQHPMLTAAALFIIFMTGSFFNSWNDSQEFSFTKNNNIIVEDQTVIVPKGKVVKGDLVVRNGDVKIEGTVEGDVTVINGEQYLASAGSVSGEIKEIDKAFEWLWYKIKSTTKEIINH